MPTEDGPVLEPVVQQSLVEGLPGSLGPLTEDGPGFEPVWQQGSDGVLPEPLCPLTEDGPGFEESQQLVSDEEPLCPLTEDGLGFDEQLSVLLVSVGVGPAGLAEAVATPAPMESAVKAIAASAATKRERFFEM